MAPADRIDVLTADAVASPRGSSPDGVADTIDLEIAPPGGALVERGSDGEAFEGEEPPGFVEGEGEGEDEVEESWLAALAHVSDVPLEAVEGAARLPQPGEILAEHFEIIRKLGEGGMGVVYLARDLMLGRQVAVKVLRMAGRGAGGREALLRSFERDGAATARLRHPNVVTVHHLGQVHGAPYLVLELLEGQELSVLARSRRLDPVEIARIVVQIARALEHAHAAGVIHRDLKPQNVFVQSDGTVKVLDFGLAALAPREVGEAEEAEDEALAERLASSPRAAGTPAYMAPEQWRGQAQDGRCDVWAVGVMLYELVCGELPFANARETLAAGPPPVPGGREGASTEIFDPIVEIALQREVEARLRSASALREALEAAEAALVEPTATRSPYRWLEAFGEEDEAWFYGREREINRLLGMVEARPLVAVVGSPGAGKSSLVSAGLAARLRRHAPPWRVIHLRPGRQPVEALHTALAERCGDVLYELVPDAAALMAAPGRAGQVLRRAAAEQGAPLLVVVDQLEELYIRSDHMARGAFAAALLSAADDAASPVRVVVTLREDFLSRLVDHAELREAVVANVLPLGPPDASGMLEALVRPARRLGYRFEEGLAEAMVEELRDESAPLPLLQFAASQLWERRNAASRLLERAVLEGLGGVAGILAAHADTVVDSLAASAEAAAARAMLCRLVTVEGARQSVERIALVGAGGDAEAAEHALDRLIAGRIVTSSKVEGQIFVELAHDALIRRWARLSEWLADNREERVFYARLSEAARHWQESGRPLGLLWRDETLAAALLRIRRFDVVAPGAEARGFLAAAQRQQRRGRMIKNALIAAALVTAAVIALGSWLATLEIDAQRVRAEAHAEQARLEKERAEQARQQAEQLAEGMLFDLRKELEPLGRLDLLERIAHAVNSYLERVGVGSVEEQRRALRQRGVTMRILGDLAHTRGDLRQATAFFQRSEAALDQLAALEPGDATTPRERATTQRRLGTVEGERGDFVGARRRYMAALEMVLPWATAWGAAPDVQEELALVHYALGNVDLEVGHTDAAAGSYADGQRIYEQLAARLPRDLSYRRGLATGFEKLGDVDMEEGRTEQAERDYQRGLEHASHVADSDPRNVHWRRDVAVLYERLGDVSMAQGRYEQASEHHRRSLAIVRLIADLDPSNASWRRDVAISYEKVGDAEAAQGRPGEALAAYEESLKITAALATSDRGNVTWQRDLAITRERMAHFQWSLRRVADARGSFDEALALRRAIVEGSPQHSPWRRELAILLRERATFLREQGHPAEAEADIREALALLEELNREDEDNWSHLLTTARVWGLLSTLPVAPRERRQAAEQAIALLRRIDDAGVLADADRVWMDELARGVGGEAPRGLER